MGEVAEQVGPFVNAYSGDLRDESLDGQRVVVGGIVTGFRTVITKAKATMAIVDPRGPAGHASRSSSSRACTSRPADLARRRDPARRRPDRPQGRGGLAAGRPRRRTGTTRPRTGPEAFAREVAAGRSRRGGGAAGRRNGHGRGNGERRRGRGRRVAAGGVRRSAGIGGAAGGRAGDRRVVPPASRRRRCRAARRSLPPDRSRPSRSRPTSRRRAAGRVADDRDDEPAGARRGARRGSWPDATADAPVDAGPATVLHVRFAGSAAPDRLVGAMEAFKALLRDRPGATRVVIHVPATGRRRSRCRWSCGGASPTTRSCWPRSAAGSAKASSTFSSPDARSAARRAGQSPVWPGAIRRMAWTDDSCSWYSARTALTRRRGRCPARGDLVDDRGLLRRDRSRSRRRSRSTPGASPCAAPASSAP